LYKIKLVRSLLNLLTSRIAYFT